MLTALILSVVAMTLIVAVPLSRGQRRLRLADQPPLARPLRVTGAAQIRSEIGWSLAGAFIYAAPAGMLAWGWQERGWTQIYSNAADYPLWWLPASVLVYLLLHDMLVLLDAPARCTGRASTSGCTRCITPAATRPHGRR